MEMASRLHRQAFSLSCKPNKHFDLEFLFFLSFLFESLMIAANDISDLLADSQGRTCYSQNDRWMGDLVLKNSSRFLKLADALDAEIFHVDDFVPANEAVAS